MTEPEGASRWLPRHVAGIAHQTGWAIPAITAPDVARIVPDRDVWDMWHVQNADGTTAIRDGRSWWFFLAAPVLPDPDMRHDRARIRLTSHGADGWRDHGETFPDGFTPGSREWSGSAVLDPSGTTLTMYFTAAGRRGEPRTMEQRLFETDATFAVIEGEPRFGDWSTPLESVAADDRWYASADQPAPVNDRIKGFRDPGYFRDPADGAEYLLFVGSAGWVSQADDGVIGVARRDGEGWTPAPPLVTALGVNNELERPHVVVHDGRYYLFWSTQAARFSAACPAGVTGLYAMVAEQMAGPWWPVNGTGLVAGNPIEEPFQGYCWWVTAELDVVSFVDAWGLHGRDPRADPALRRAQFGGTVAPWFRLAIDGDRVGIVF